MMEINWKHDVHNDDLLNFRTLFPKYHPFLSLSLLSWWWWWQNTFFHSLDKKFHPQLNQVVPRQPYVGQRQQLPERTEGVATHFHHKVTFLKMMRMATIIIVITIVSSVRSSNSHPKLLVIQHPTHFFRSHRSSTLDLHFLSHYSNIKAIMLHKGKTWQDSGILWDTLAYSGVLWHTLAYSSILWHTLAYSCILWHTLAYSGILWHTMA